MSKQRRRIEITTNKFIRRQNRKRKMDSQKSSPKNFNTTKCPLCHCTEKNQRHNKCVTSVDLIYNCTYTSKEPPDPDPINHTSGINQIGEDRTGNDKDRRVILGHTAICKQNSSSAIHYQTCHDPVFRIGCNNPPPPIFRFAPSPRNSVYNLQYA